MDGDYFAINRILEEAANLVGGSKEPAGNVEQTEGYKRKQIERLKEFAKVKFKTKRRKEPIMRRPKIVKTLSDILRRIAPDATAILYGSEARGEAHSDSDIDLLILVDKEKLTLKEEQEITYPLYDVEIDTGVMINPIVISRKKWENLKSRSLFYYNVMKEGIVL